MVTDDILGLILSGKFDSAIKVIETLDPQSFRYRYLKTTLYATMYEVDIIKEKYSEWFDPEKLNETQRFFLDLTLLDYSLNADLLDYHSRDEIIQGFEHRLESLPISEEKKKYYGLVLLGYRGVASIASGLYNNAETFLSESIKIIDENSLFQRAASALMRILHGIVHLELGDYETAKRIFSEVKDYSKKDNNILGYGRSSTYLAYSEFLTGNFKTGLNELLECLNYIKENHLPKADLGIVYLLLSRIYLSKGEYNVAKRFLLSAIENFESFNDKRNLANCYAEMGAIYYEQGMLDMALESYQKSLASNLKLGNQLKIAIAMKDIATVNHERKPDSTYGEYLNIALEQALKVGHSSLVAELCYYLITGGSVDKSRKEYAMSVFSDITKDADESSDVTLLYKLTKSSMLKNSTRIIDKFEAQQIYFSIIENKKLHSKFLVDAYLALFELLLLELKISSDSGEDVMEDIRIISQKLEDYLKISGSMNVRLKLMILRSRFFLLEQKLDDAQKTLLEAEELAIAKGFYSLKEKIAKERSDLTAYIAKWLKLIEQNKENIENYRRKQIIEYLNDASKVVKMF